MCNTVNYSKADKKMTLSHVRKEKEEIIDPNNKKLEKSFSNCKAPLFLWKNLEFKGYLQILFLGRMKFEFLMRLRKVLLKFIEFFGRQFSNIDYKVLFTAFNRKCLMYFHSKFYIKAK